jgi:hypothetical protein
MGLPLFVNVISSILPLVVLLNYLPEEEDGCDGRVWEENINK